MKALKDADYYFRGITEGNRFVLGEAITLMESTHAEKSRLASKVADLCLKNNEGLCTTRIAITGSPGAGKSTFIDVFGMLLLKKGHKVAVLAIDPSSRKSAGSILGDKTRMESLSMEANAFIRPTPAGEFLGGVAFSTKESIPLFEAAGYDFVIIETVGVGQSEYLASEMSDATLLLIQPGSGDEVQGIKRGIVEMADFVIVTKADGSHKELASKSRVHYKEALHYASRREDGHQPEVSLVSSKESTGLEEVYENLMKYMTLLRTNDILESRRIQQEGRWFQLVMKEKAITLLLKNPIFAPMYHGVEEKIRKHNISTHSAILKLEEIIDHLVNP